MLRDAFNQPDAEASFPQDHEPAWDHENKRTWQDALGRDHRENGPAVEWTDGTKVWKRHGRLHREDGPAYEGADGTRQWYLNDKELKFEAFTAAVKQLRREREEQQLASQALLHAAADVFRRGVPEDIVVRRVFRLKIIF